MRIHTPNPGWTTVTPSTPGKYLVASDSSRVYTAEIFLDFEVELPWYDMPSTVSPGEPTVTRFGVVVWHPWPVGEGVLLATALDGTYLIATGAINDLVVTIKGDQYLMHSRSSWHSLPVMDKSMRGHPIPNPMRSHE